MHHTIQKLNALRHLMKEKSIDAYLIPAADPHLGENIPDHWRIIAWLTGFTGSAANVVITDVFAGLWTDSRYFVQADNQLRDTCFSFNKSVPSEKKDHITWLGENLKHGCKIGIDGNIFSISQLRKLQTIMNEKYISIDTETDLISELWTDRPLPSGLPAFEHHITFCGMERADKICEVQSIMKTLKVDYHLLTSVDDIMWLLNIRGRDVMFSPLLTSFAIVGEEQIMLFADENKIPLKMAREFDDLGIVLLPYEETGAMLAALPHGSSILTNPAVTSVSLYNSIPGGIRIKEDISIPTRLKAIKNIVEIENTGKAMIRDGVALTKFFFKIEHEAGSVVKSEVTLAEMINNLRSEQENYLCPGFSTIVAWNEHGALPHYSPVHGSDSVIGTDGLLLVDSGGQYLDGTTDITRTIALGRSTPNQKKDFTLVLKGMINLALAKFPAGTKGYQLDILARKTLWQNGLNYGHGTGHGVGYCLNVHEGPQSIGPSSDSDAKTIISPGMIISNEPGIYREGKYGIRIENLLICSEDEETEFGRFYRFDTLSLCYIDKSLIDIALLDKREIDWLNDYHSVVFDKLSPLLTQEEQIWLRSKTNPL